MQVALSGIDSLDVGQSEIVNEAKNRNLWFTGIGIAGPAITGGAKLLLNGVAMALFIGLGPMFILCLLFEKTKPLFPKCLFCSIGTMFSLDFPHLVFAASEAPRLGAEWVSKGKTQRC